MIEYIVSVGVDIGTTTTNVIFSRLAIENVAGISSAPLIKVVGKEIFYRSGAFFTPLLSREDIDTDSLMKLIDDIYIDAHVNKNEVKTGAVIITGETARKNNADRILQQISDYSGDFVVAVAGSDLESIIAGKGAGASLLSKEKHANVINFDIGGGTTNLALFSNGNAIDTTCLDIGGRMIQIEHNTIKSMTDKSLKIVDECGLDIKIGKNADMTSLSKFCEVLVEVFAQILGLKPKGVLCDILITSHDWNKEKADFLTFSGGVSDYVYDDFNGDLFKFGDIGPLLGSVLRKSTALKSIPWIKGVETQQATVVGAGVYSVDLSGSTIDYLKDILPLKNIPIIKLTENEEVDLLNGNLDKIKKRINWYDESFVALSFVGSTRYSFDEIKSIANNIASIYSSDVEKMLPIVVVIEKDMAKALGLCLRTSVNKKDYPIVCIDSVVLENGDYVDIGLPVGNGVVLPVMIKTLLFNEGNFKA